MEQKHRHTKKILLLGSYGQTNLGDDLLMWNYLAFLRERGFEDIYVNANQAALIPKVIRKAYPEMHIMETYKTSTVAWARLLRRMDYVVYGGGTLYKELYSSTGRSKHSVTMRMMGFNLLTRLSGTKLYHLHIGIGSLTSNIGKKIARLSLRAATYSLFRDQPSYDFARQVLRLPSSIIGKSTDGLFISRRWEQPWREAPLTIDPKKYKTVVGINMLSDIPDWVNRKQYIAAMRQFIKELLEAGNFVVLLPFQHDFNANNDHHFMQKEIVPHIAKYKNFVLPAKVEIDEIISYLRQCDVLVGMRFHSLLLATAAHTPFVAIMYDTKCARFIEEIDYPHAVPLETLTPDALRATFDHVLHNTPAIARKLQKTAAAQYKTAEEGLRDIRL